jgi:hypothetical protein
MKKLALLFSLFVVGIILSFPSFAQFNVNISTGATANMTITNVGSVRTFTANAATANVQIADIIAAYTGGVTEVRILTGSTGGTQDGNITFGNAIDYNGIGLGKTLTLIANNTINATQNITDGTAGGDLLNLNFTGNGAGAGVSTIAGVRMAATFQTNGGNITIAGTQNDVGAKGVDIPSGNISTAGGFLSVTGTANGASAFPNTCDGIDIQSTTTNTNGGAITLIGTSTNATGNNGVQVDSPLNSGAGAITITGISNGNAVGVVNTIGSITSTSGNITITGTANSTLLTAMPQVLAAGVSIVTAVSATSGNITINAINNANAPAFFNSVGLGMNNGTITTTTGNITINGTANNNNATATFAFGIRILTAINTTSGTMNFTGIANASAYAFALTGMISIGSINANSGTINITGTSNNTGTGIASFGVLINSPMTNIGTANLTINGESNGDAPAVYFLNAPITANGGDITITGNSKKFTTAGADGILLGISNDSPITNTTGKITLTGYNEGTASALNIFSNLTTTTGDISLNGTSVQGYGIYANANIQTNGGKINLVGEGRNSFGGILGETGRTINSNGGDITMNGVAKSTTSNAIGVILQNTTNSGAGKITIMGESNGNASAIQISNTLTSAGGDITLTANAQSTTASGQAALQIDNNISSGVGKIIATGTSNGNNEGIKLANPSIVSSTSGDITFTGIALSNTVGNTNAQSIDIESTITSTSGRVMLTGTNNANAVAFYLQTAGNINNTSGDIIINATANSTAGGRGFRMRGNIANTSGKTQITATNNANTEALFIENGTFTIGNDITLSGTAKNTTGGIGVLLQRPINTGAGKITITGESNGDAPAVRFTNAPVTAAGGDITITGNSKKFTTAGADGILLGISNDSPITNTTGKITLTGYNEGTASALNIFSNLTTTTGDISLNGTSVQGYGIYANANIQTNGGKINLAGEGRTLYGGILGETGRTINSNGGDITMNGVAKSTTSNAVGVILQNTTNSGAGKITITGESNGDAPAVRFSNAPVTAAGGDITITGNAKKITTAGANGIDIGSLGNSPITNTTGKITITGYNGGAFSAIDIFSNLTTTTGDISLNGVSEQGNGIFISANIQTNGGKINLLGEGRTIEGGINGTGNGTINSNGGDITMNGVAKSTTSNALGVRLLLPINSGTGKITITGESNGNGTAVLFSDAPLTAAGGDITIVGNAKKLTNSFINAIRIEGNSPITNTTGKITITGYNGGAFSAIDIFNNLTTTTGDISLNGVSEQGNGIFISANIQTNGGKINLLGEGRTIEGGINGTGNGTINSNGGDITMNGVAKSMIGGARGVIITTPINAGNGKLTIIGESANSNEGILSNFSIVSGKDISLRSNSGNINFVNNSFIQSTNGGAIDICVAPSYSLIVSGSVGGNSIQTTGGASITITNGGSSLAVGNANNLVGLISNGTNTISAGTYTSQTLGNIKINNNLKISTSQPLSTANINNYTIRVRLDDICTGSLSFANPLTVTNFSLTNTPAGMTIQSVLRLSNIEAVITLGYTGSDDILDLVFPLAQLNIGGTAFNPLSGTLSIAIPIAEGAFIPPVLKGKARSQSVDLTWDAVFGARVYEIYGYAAGQPQQFLGTTDENKFTVTGLKNGTTYFFRINAVTSRGTRSGFSNLVELRPSIVLGTEEEILNNTFAVYPNPNNGSFNIAAKELKGKNAEISIMDLSGRLIYHQKMNLSGNLETEFQLSVGNGVYILQLRTDKEVYQRKIAIEK